MLFQKNKTQSKIEKEIKKDMRKNNKPYFFQEKYISIKKESKNQNYQKDLEQGKEILQEYLESISDKEKVKIKEIQIIPSLKKTWFGLTCKTNPLEIIISK